MHPRTYDDDETGAEFRSNGSLFCSLGRSESGQGRTLSTATEFAAAIF
jgi:hypothetical protein